MPGGHRIVVVGSVNMDLVCRTPHIPAAGETIIGDDLVTIAGGKGANQAVAAAKLARPDTEVFLVARIGGDDFGQRLLKGLRQQRVRTEHVTRTEGVASGCAMILVDDQGENTIVVARGANAKLTPVDVDHAEPLIKGAAAVVLQLEIPLDTVRRAIAACRGLGVPIILDPAPVPARGLPRDLFRVDVLTPNQGEAELLLGRKRTHRVSARKLMDPKLIAGDLLARGARSVVLKLGSRGSLLIDQEGRFERAKAFKVKVIDSTAAGDAFTAGLAVARAEGRDPTDALRFANAAGAVCCTQFGAQPSLPSRQAVEKLL
jgi:ribokinase